MLRNKEANGMFLNINGLAKSFGDNEVLKDINVEINKGEVLSIIGPSGSGKLRY